MRRHKAEEIVATLRHVEGLAASGRRISECVREIGVTEVTYYRWRKRYGGIESDLAAHLTELEAEITRLRRLVSDLTLEKLILMESTTEALSQSFVRPTCFTPGQRLVSPKACLPGAWAASIDSTQDTGALFRWKGHRRPNAFGKCEFAVDEPPIVGRRRGTARGVAPGIRARRARRYDPGFGIHRRNRFGRLARGTRGTILR